MSVQISDRPPRPSPWRALRRLTVVLEYAAGLALSVNFATVDPDSPVGSAFRQSKSSLAHRTNHRVRRTPLSRPSRTGPACVRRLVLQTVIKIETLFGESSFNTGFSLGETRIINEKDVYRPICKAHYVPRNRLETFRVASGFFYPLILLIRIPTFFSHPQWPRTWSLTQTASARRSRQHFT
jgi:hypothetical protein